MWAASVLHSQCWETDRSFSQLEAHGTPFTERSVLRQVVSLVSRFVVSLVPTSLLNRKFCRGVLS